MSGFQDRPASHRDALHGTRFFKVTKCEMTFEEAYEAHVKEREASGTDKRVYDDESVEGKMEAVEVSDPAPSKAAPPLPKAGDVYARLGL